MKFPEKFRIVGSPNESGAFSIPFEGRYLNVIASDELDWDHVSVSLNTRCPNWREMSIVKSLFWNDDQCVMQLHTPKKEHINLHPYCLHLWAPQKLEIPRPPNFMV